MEVLATIIIIISGLLVFTTYHVEQLIKDKKYLKQYYFTNNVEVEKDIRTYSKIRTGLVITLILLHFIGLYVLTY